MQDRLIDHKLILDWGVQAFIAAGVPKADADIIAGALVKTSLWGIDSHGIARITHYLARFTNGTIKSRPLMHLDRTAAATGRLDGDDGHGIVIMTEATNQAISLAREAGVGVVGVHNSSHCGAIGLYTRQVTAAGMVGIAFTHADALVVPHNGHKAFFGTNPISIAFPTNDSEEPVCLDMATSIVPWNYVMNARRENTMLPPGIGVDKDGNDCQDPHQAVAVKPMAGHKGYALAFMIDLLCGPLNGMAYGPDMTSMYHDMDKQRKLGSLVIAIDPERFGGREYIKAAGSAIITRLKDYGDDVLFPGQPEYIRKEIREKEGIPVSDAVLKDFNDWSHKLGIDPIK